MKRVGLLGGTFDPVHNGHVQLAKLAKNQLQLDKVLLVPAAEPPHKNSEKISSFAHRSEMLRRALARIDGIEPCFIEGELEKPSFTIDTIRFLQNMNKDRYQYYFIIGIDAFVDILSWKSYRELLQKVSMVVVNRKGFKGKGELANIALTLGYNFSSNTWQSSSDLHIVQFLDSSPIKISSSQIRAMLCSNTAQDVPGVHPDVLFYARENKLYLM